jgi:hypothetical protein
LIKLIKSILINVFRELSLPGAPLPKAMMVTPAIFCESLSRDTKTIIVVGISFINFLTYEAKKTTSHTEKPKTKREEREVAKMAVLSDEEGAVTTAKSLLFFVFSCSVLNTVFY